MPKRSSTDSQTTPTSSEQGDVDQKPSSSDNEDYKPDVSPSKKARKSPKKSSGEVVRLNPVPDDLDRLT
jgi:hypothetical protein